MAAYKLTQTPGVFVCRDFLEEYLPTAPGDYVRVYLYALLCAQTGQELAPQSIAGTLHLSCEQVEDAFAYWIKKGVMTEQQEPQNPLYTEGAYLKRASALLSRTLTTTEVTILCDLKEVYHLPEEVVLMLLQHVTDPAVKGKRVSLKYVEKAALAWAEEGIVTKAQAEEKIRAYRASASGLTRVLRTLYSGKNRPANEVEIALYEKWTKQWGFTQDGIALLLPEAALISEPSMKYLDRVLQSYYERGIVTAAEIQRVRDKKETRREKLLACLDALQYTRKRITPELESAYEDWLSMGFSHKCILYACSYAAQMGNHSYKKADALLRAWKSQGVTTTPKIEEYLKNQSEIDGKISQIHDCAGITGPITDSDRKNYRYAVQELALPHELVLYAADVSALKQDPKSYMYKLVASWANEGVTTVEAAKRTMNKQSKAKKAVGDYLQREYDEAYFEQQKKNRLERLKNYDG